MAELLVIVPSRGRPEAVKALKHAWNNTTGGESELLIAVDDDDPKLEEYQSMASLEGLRLRVGPRKRLGPTLNEVALEEANNYPYLGFMGDDHRPLSMYWDSHYIAFLHMYHFVYGDDRLQGENLPTQIAMRSDVVKALGYMSPPTLVHMYIDDAWKAWGLGIDSIKYDPHVIIEHLHPVAGKAPQDELYTEVWAYMEPDSQRWREYRDSGRLAEDIEKLKNYGRD